MRTAMVRVGWTVVALGLLCACAQGAWDRTRAQDTLAAYSQFIRDHPSSMYVNDAQERMAYLRVKTYQTRESFEEFNRSYPHSDYLPELRALIEPLYFEVARAANSAAAYREFLRAYPEGTLAARAQGNLTYIEDVLPAVDEAKLRAFLEENPQSDFAAEAQRTIELLELQRVTQISRLGVRVEVSPNVKQPNRVRQGFAALFSKVYRERGIEVRLLDVDAAPGGDLDAWASVDYREAPAPGVLGSATMLANCRIQLYHRSLDQPIWDRTFEAPADHLIQGVYGRDKTVFASSKYRFWDQFFVPLATWAVSETEVQAKQYLEDVQAVDVLGGRAALLLERGGVDFLDVSSPPAAQVIDRYRREIDLATWTGIRLLREDLAVTYGSDGLEMIRRAESSAERMARFDGTSVGAVTSAALYDSNTLLFGSKQGLYAVRLNRAPLVPQRLLDGEVVAVETQGPYVVVVRPSQIEVGLPKHLILHLTEKKVSLGRFEATRARMVGDQLFLLGRRGVLHVSLHNPVAPKVARLLPPEEIGRIPPGPGKESVDGKRP